MNTQEGELPGSDSKEDTSNWVARVGRKKAAGEEEATQHNTQGGTHRGTKHTTSNWVAQAGRKKPAGEEEGTQHTRRNKTQKEEYNTEGGHLIRKKAAAEEEGGHIFSCSFNIHV